MNKVVIITGATSGIGKAIADKFISTGNTVIAIGRNKERLSNIEKQYPNNVITFKTDVSNENEILKLFEAIKLKYNQVDILINAAGFNKMVSTQILFSKAIENWDSVINTNLKGAFMMSMQASQLLKKPGGRIINISSIGAFTGGSSIGGIAYAASKAGLNGLTFGLARELSKEGITVNSIAPGFIENTGFTSVFPSERVQQIVNSIPMNRAGNVNDIAEICFFYVQTMPHTLQAR